ncbi:hypothetical protein WN944_012030 [Citrus x changshan-huyou]|uniref:Uncharacterized protein n=1 Tax=Citrus x changshan-huyou TaxID=2935761 RepID=A0AAP0QU81_9ROSI
MLKGVRNVINYDKPAAAYIKTYIHRAGPRARAGQNGHCFTLLPKDEECCHLDSFPLLGLFFTTVKRFKKLLQQADHDSCPVHSIPSSSIESLRPIYKSESLLTYLKVYVLDALLKSVAILCLLVLMVSVDGLGNSVH